MITRKKLPKFPSYPIFSDEADREFDDSWPGNASEMYSLWLDHYNAETQTFNTVMRLMGAVELMLKQSAGSEAECIEKSLELIDMAISSIGYDYIDRRSSMGAIVGALAEGKGQIPERQQRIIHRPQIQDSEDV